MNMHYLQPASQWVEALPQGNGRLGAMVFGGTAQERLALNEDTLWSGHPGQKMMPDAYDHVQECARLVLEGRNREAEEAVEAHLTGEFSQSYEPLGDLLMDFPALEGQEVQDYRRSLSLEDGVAQVSFTCGGVRYARRSFISHPQQVICLRMEASEPVIATDIRFTSPLRHSLCVQGQQLTVSLRCPSQTLPNYYDRSPSAIVYDDAPEKQGVSATAILRVDSDGVISAGDGEMHVRGAGWLEIRLACRSNFEGFDRYPGLSGVDHGAKAQRDMDAAAGMTFPELLEAHVQDFAPRMALQGIRVAGPSQEALPTDERLRLYTAGGEDASLPVLLYQFGRYLLLSGSRPGTRALNLQGIWNDMLQPPWSSNYTTNINTEMNYWPAEITGIPGAHEPLFDLVDALTVTGSEVAREYFHARGAAVGHNADVWGHSVPVGMQSKGSAVWGWWTMAHAWLSGHFFEHYIYTADKAFLRERALPVLRSAAQFCIDASWPDEKGLRTIRPATSPENRYLLGGERLAVCRRAAMTDEIIRETLGNYLAALDILEETEEDAQAARELLAALPPLSIGQDGRLMEWDRAYEEPEPQHRHVSHLCGLFPGHLHSPRRDPQVTQAIRRSLEVRGDEGTGWSLGWKVNLWARLEDGDRALSLLRQQLRLVDTSGTNYVQGGGSYANLFCAHPPFQIDGNFAAASGVPRLLMDSALDEITLLPALPSSWQNVEAHGLCGANGYRADIRVEGGKLVSLRLTSGSDRPTTLRLGGKEIVLTLKKGESVVDPQGMMA